MALSAGTAVTGRLDSYRISARIQEGGMAWVYEGWSSEGSPVVVKAPRVMGDGHDAVRLEKLRVEAKILKGLDHSSIVRYLDEEDRGSDFYLILERVYGKTLKELYTGKPASEVTATDITVQLLRAVQHLHGRNILHRDINHKNILVDADGKLTLIDFGAAKEGYIQIQPQATIMYTPGWEPPESRVGGATFSSDLYGVGAVLFFLLTGQEPRLYLDGAGKLQESPRNLGVGVSDGVSAVVEKAMEPNVLDRYQSAGDMITQLTTGKLAHFGAPHVVVLGEKVKLTGTLEVGREHGECQADCKARGYTVPPKVAVSDPGNYISKHHARVVRDAHGRCFVLDLGSLNRTAVSRDGGVSYTLLEKGGRAELKDGDMVALAYAPARGAYLTMSFRTV